MAISSASVSRTASSPPPYPVSAVTDVMREELLRAVRARFKRKGESISGSDDQIVALPVEIDSLTVVELLSSLDDILPFTVSESVVRAGGYGSIQDALQHVVGRIEAKWNKHHAGGKP